MSGKDNSKFENNCYSPGTIYSLIDVIDQFMFCEDDKVFDFGFGKGGALISFWSTGIDTVGGVELDDGLYDIAEHNFRKLSISAGRLIKGDARTVTDALDEYNYFFMYNPFHGGVFEDVIYNMEQSIARQNRNVFLIYVAPVMHEAEIKNRVFKLVKKIPTDYWFRDAYIYKAGLNE